MGTVSTTREEWLQRAIEMMRPWFKDAGAPLPLTIRVSTGWASGRVSKGAIGWTYSTSLAADGNSNVFVSPAVSDSVDVLAVLVHELVHVAHDCKSGHGPAFRRVATAVGLGGRMTATVPTVRLVDRLEGFIAEHGKYPHAALLPTDGVGPTGRKKQTTRMLKYVCSEWPENKVRVSQGNINEYGPPLCGCHLEEMVPG